MTISTQILLNPCYDNEMMYASHFADKRTEKKRKQIDCLRLYNCML